MAGVMVNAPGESPALDASTAIGVRVVTKPTVSWARDLPEASVVSNAGRMVARPLLTRQATGAPAKGLLSLPVRVTSRESCSGSATQPVCKLPPVTARDWGVIGAIGAAESPHAASTQRTVPRAKLVIRGGNVLMAPPAART